MIHQKVQNMQLVYSYCGNIVKQLSCNMCIVSLAFVNGSVGLLHELILIGSEIIQNSHPSIHQQFVLSSAMPFQYFVTFWYELRSFRG